MVAFKYLMQGALASAAGQMSIVKQIDSIRSVLTHCNISQDVDKIDLAPINNQIVPPSNLTLDHVGLAFGVQNYTCTQSNNFTNVGAVAELFDVSCLVNSNAFETLPQSLFTAWNATEDTPIQDFITLFHAFNTPDILAQHYFVTNPTTGQGVSPKWDFTSSGDAALAGNPNAFVIAKGKTSIPAPNNTTDINWLDVVNVGGDAGGQAAAEVLRTTTVGGQPPATCQFGQTQDISVKYTSFYWFFGGALGSQ